MPEAAHSPSRSDGWKLWVAQGFGVGRIPWAPGTFGSVAGLAWTAALLATGSPLLFAMGIVAGFGLSVWLCGEAERILGIQDPGSVVLDEIAALPLCFIPWIVTSTPAAGGLPPVASLFTSLHGTLAIAGFLLFRLFDIWKPSPIRQSQRLPGGWGVTVDDFLAAAAAALLLAGLLKVVPAG
ncbi:MAG TPA: phosphatidylglycerophosphatase A [Verrucomicrobiales bacterium]|nr:phosphatidylglycerophosphatase A [Verrucomicrobiales bacterium]